MLLTTDQRLVVIDFLKIVANLDDHHGKEDAKLEKRRVCYATKTKFCSHLQCQGEISISIIRA